MSNGKTSRYGGSDNEAVAVTRMLRTSPQKLNLVARQIRNKPVNDAVNELLFSKRRIAREVWKTLMSAVANAENNHALDVDQLVVSEAWVGKNLTMKRGPAPGPGPLRADQEAIFAVDDQGARSRFRPAGRR